MAHKQLSSQAGYFVAWKTDASMFFGAAEDTSVDARGDRDKLKNLQLVLPPALKDFESNGALVVAGDRGTGKSLILAKKAAQRLVQSSSDKRKYLTLVDRPPFVSLLLPNSISVPSREYRRFASAKVWSRIWGIVLKAHFACMSVRERDDPQARDAAYVLKHYFQIGDEPNNAVLRELLINIWTSFNVQETIAPTLKFLVQKSPSQDDLERWSQITSSAIGRAAEGSWQQAIFVDGIDEAMGDPMGESLFNRVRLDELDQTTVAVERFDASEKDERAIDRSLALELILHSQTGFMLAADEIRTEFSSLKCYGAVRHEAAAWILDPTKTGKLASKVQGGLITVVAYLKDQLDAIFELNVEYSDPAKELAVPESEDPSKRLYGFKSIRHSSVLGKDGIEDIRDLLIRHTFGVPRQLVSIAKATLEAVSSPAKRRDQIDKIVNAIDEYAATTLWADYISSVNPPWFDLRAAGIHKVERNVLNQDALQKLENDHPGLASFLYSRGMLGRPVGKPGSTVLEFHKANGVEVKMPQNYEYMVAHPVLSAYLCSGKSPSQRHEYYISDFIVGNGMPCPRRVVEPVFRLIFEGEAKWTFQANGKEITFNELKGPGENPLLTELESTRAAAFLLIIIALGMKRHQVEWVTIDQLAEECAHVSEAMGQELTIHNRPILQFATSRLKKTGEIEEAHILNSVLRGYGLGVSASAEDAVASEKADDTADTTQPVKKKEPARSSARRFSLRQAPDARAVGPKGSWPVVPPAMIAIRMVQPRQPIG